MDLVWVMDMSSSVVELDVYSNMTNFVAAYGASSLLIGPTLTRQAFVEYAGDFIFYHYPLIGNVSDFASPRSTNVTLFNEFVQSLQASGGTTNTPYALDYVRTSIFTPQSFRPGSRRIVVLATDGRPTDNFGLPSDLSLTQKAAMELRKDTGALLVLIKIGYDFSPNFLKNETDVIIQIDNYDALTSLIGNDWGVLLRSRYEKTPLRLFRRSLQSPQQP